MSSTLIRGKLRSFSRSTKWQLGVVGVLLVGAFFSALETRLMDEYRSLESLSIRDRHGKVIFLSPNKKGHYAVYAAELPGRLSELLVKKEDRYFYSHPGVNPVSTLRAALSRVFGNGISGGSTITQQLVKNLLHNEAERTLWNKTKELAYSFALELFQSKKTVLEMYANSVYFGNQAQGVAHAAHAYFNKNPNELSDTEIVSLLAAISSPTSLNPLKPVNRKETVRLAASLSVPIDIETLRVARASRSGNADIVFELGSMSPLCARPCSATIDNELSVKLREIVKRNVDAGKAQGAANAAVVVIKLPENELLSVIGSPRAGGESDGANINMAIEPRPIGSTAKPFIYLKAFENGLRPYTLVDDREYKFPVAVGFPLYPKNYDGAYRGIVTLYESLSNSLNVPAVKVLEYVGLNDFYAFLERTLGFTSLQPLESYQYGIALGGLEMDPLSLASYFTIFPQRGEFVPLTLYQHEREKFKTPMSRLAARKMIAAPEYTELVTKILSDRESAVEQFGLTSNLTLGQKNYAVKTGTSRDYHDSWTVGYTPDFLVAVWYGNAENKPLKQVTGQSGAGKIWREAMELLLNSEYNKKTPLSFDSVKAVAANESLTSVAYGLAGDEYEFHRNVLLDNKLIASPHSGDVFLFERKMEIPLRSSKPVSWFVNAKFLNDGSKVFFQPSAPGTYLLRAESGKNSESIKITISRPQ